MSTAREICPRVSLNVATRSQWAVHMIGESGVHGGGRGSGAFDGLAPKMLDPADSNAGRS